MSQKGLPDGTKTGRGSLATDQVKALWREAYRIYLNAEGDSYNKKRDRTMRITEVAQRLGVARKVAKRRVKNYEGWQKRTNPTFRKA